RIDTEAARAYPGVHRVLTGEDIRAFIPNPHYGPAFHDQPILALDKVRYAGEPVALVLATDPHTVEAAAQTIVVDCEELPGVFDEVEAMRSQAIVHEEQIGRASCRERVEMWVVGGAWQKRERT